MSKRVRITIEVDDRFVRLLNANVQLSGLREKSDVRQLSPSEALALVACAEMRGGLEVEVDALVPIEWRPHLDVIHSERKVTEI